MIRINLLPAKSGGSGGGLKVLLIFIIVLGIEAVGLYSFQMSQEEELSQVQKTNTNLRAEIAKIQKETAQVEVLEAEKEELEKQKRVLMTLKEGQSGPVKLLDELSRILSPIEDPEEKLKARNMGWTVDWDQRRLWVDTFVEQSRVLKISGHARNNNDVAEFLNRLESSKHFVQTRLQISEAVELAQFNKAQFVNFKIESLAIYGPGDVKRLAVGELGVSKKKKRGH
ncbi:PilN domain-containing protein [Myxococcota bacterium]|nr:PilN domain-containing protein [Myxococcota bacterium]MBU1898947.1 PilN domain-containing protein [Myxococcota bacterium]